MSKSLGLGVSLIVDANINNNDYQIFILCFLFGVNLLAVLFNYFYNIDFYYRA